LKSENDGLTEAAKVVSMDELLRLRDQWRRAGRVVVWTNGCFDMLHLGHVRSLQAARDLGDVLIVGVNSDASVASLKGCGRPIALFDERAEVLAALECVSAVVGFGELTPERSIATIEPDIHVKGADYAPPDGKPVPAAAIVESYGGRVCYLPLIEGISTTDRLRRIAEGGPQE
jgi:D-beta-D-heptose 7-phosphate kinase/D-beta-D-heptose 1-phosphate adenosyltransferase